MKQDQNNVTNLLQAWSTGDKAAGEQLWPILFAELKSLAHRQIAGETPGHTLQSGALVNELQKARKSENHKKGFAQKIGNGPQKHTSARFKAVQKSRRSRRLYQ